MEDHNNKSSKVKKDKDLLSCTENNTALFLFHEDRKDKNNIIGIFLSKTSFKRIMAAR